MVKKIIFGSLTVIFLGALIFAYLHFRQLKSPVLDALHSIPASAAVILKSNHTETLIAKVRDGNLMWEELLNLEYFQQLNTGLVFIDSLIKSNQGLVEVLREKPLYLSLHRAGAGRSEYLVSLSFPPSTNGKQINQVIQNAAKGAIISNRLFEEASISTLKQGNNTYHYSFHKGILVFSQSGHLLESSIAQINSGNYLIDDSAFAAVHSTANDKVNANLFINYRNFIPLSTGFLGIESEKLVSPLAGFANWAAMDLSIKPNAVMLNGFSFSHDSLDNYVNLLARQKPQPIEITRSVPANVASMLFYGFSNFSAYYQDFRLHQAKLNPEKEQEVEQFYKDFGQEAEFNLFSWVANEVAVVVTEPDTFGLKHNTFAVFKASNIENARTQLATFGISDSITIYKDFEIRKLPIGNAYKTLLGNSFANILSPYFTNIGRYIIIGNSTEALIGYINEFLADRTLQGDSYYAAFSENIASDANLYIYSNIRKSLPIYKSFIKQEHTSLMEDNEEWLGKFEALAFQLNSNNELFYHNFFLKYNPNAKQQNVSLWEAQLDTTVSSKPRIVHNHLNNSKEIIVQDEGNKIYLISNTGKILWKKQIEEKIMGEIHQVDLFKNNKLQYLFNTTSALYAIDRNGDYVEKFPVLFQDKATAPFALMDYENNRDYRIIIPNEGLKIYNYTSTGELVKGWNPVQLENRVNSAVQHIDIAGKDYMLALDEKGKVYVFDRKGDPRAKLREKLPVSPKNQVFYIEKGKSLAKTYIVTTDSTGTIFKLNLVDELEKATVKELSPFHKMDFKDLNGDKTREFVFTDKNKLLVFNASYQPKFEYEFQNNIESQAQYFLFPDGNGKIGVVDQKAGEIYLFDEAGNLFYNFPLKGSTPFSIGNINQDRNLNLVTGSGKNIFLYQLK